MNKEEIIKNLLENAYHKIKKSTENGKTPFMTEGFVDMQIEELLETLKIVKG